MIVATAGHVDHGKTLLVKALTGVDTDRLPEEKKRGLTIDLGFAYHDIGDGELTGFIDVPGHEKFIRTMLAGVSGIDCVLFIVAADDGPMPQTLEHLAIMDLLQVTHGLFAVTKIDRVAPERVAQVRDEITALIATTSLANSPIVPVSAMNGDGIESLRAELFDIKQHIPQQQTSGNFRLAIDRNFVIQGAGRVITGTVLSGQINIEDRVRLLPADIELRVRGIHAQNAASDQANAGQRCALNIAGADLKRLEIHRGDWVVAEKSRFTFTKIDAVLSVLSGENKPLKNRTPIHLHIGAADVTGRIVTLEGQEIAPGDHGLVQIQLHEPVNSVFGERFVVRDQSALRTVGGGLVIDPKPVIRGRNKPLRMQVLKAQNTTDHAQALSNLLDLGLNDFNYADFVTSRNLNETQSRTLADEVNPHLVQHAFGINAFSLEKWQALVQLSIKAVAQFHETQPNQAGISEGTLTRALPKGLRKNVSREVIESTIREQHLVREGGLLRLPNHQTKQSPENTELWLKISNVLEVSGRKAPVVHDLHTSLGIELKSLNAFLSETAKQGHLVRISDKRYFLPQTIREFALEAEKLSTQSNGAGFTVKEFRDLSGIGRNAVIEILEYFDRIGLTFRQEQIRKTRKSVSEILG